MVSTSHLERVLKLRSFSMATFSINVNLRFWPEKSGLDVPSSIMWSRNGAFGDWNTYTLLCDVVFTVTRSELNGSGLYFWALDLELWACSFWLVALGLELWALDFVRWASVFGLRPLSFGLLSLGIFLVFSFWVLVISLWALVFGLSYVFWSLIFDPVFGLGFRLRTGLSLWASVFEFRVKPKIPKPLLAASCFVK